MEEKTIVHTYEEPKMEPFWWIFHLIVITIGALFGVALVVVPIVLYMTYQIIWLLILFILIPLGFWIARGCLRNLKRVSWHNNHLSSFTLFNNKIESVEWTEAYSKLPIQQVIPFSSLTSVIASSYIIRQTINTVGLGRVISETGPILYIRYLKDGQQKVLNLPFANHGDNSMNVWLRHFQDRQIPIQYTARQIYRNDTQFLNDEQRLDYFESSEELIDFPFSGTWLTAEPKIWTKWKDKEVKLRAEEEAKDPELKKARQKHTFKTWILTIWLVSMLMFLAVFCLKKLGQTIPFLVDSMIPGLFIFTLGAFLFFYCLRSYLRWFYMITFSLMVIILGFSWTILSVSETGVDAPTNLTLFGASVLFPLLVWIPYFTVKKSAKKTASKLKSI